MISRQEKIIEIIQNEAISKQEQLVQRLTECGYTATQATVSRDIRTLGIRKATQGERKGCYITENHDVTVPEHYRRVLREGFLRAETAMNLVVIRTAPGMAMAVAAALDAFHFTEVVGSIAGDDTIFCATADVAGAKKLKKKIDALL